MRSSLILTALLLLVLLAVALPVAASSDSSLAPVARFVVIGDRTGGHVAGVYELAIADIERLHPDFVITVGDQIEGYSTDTTELNKQWDEYLTIIKPLTVPLFITPGNHDITYDAAQPTFEHRVGKPYRSFDVDSMHFVILDNSRWESSDKLPAAELSWLGADMASHSGAAHTLVFFHKPFWFNSTAMGRPDTLHTLFVTYGVDAVFSGHFHQYFSGKYDGIQYTGVGSSGATMDENDPSGLGYHYAWVTVTKNQIEVVPIKVGASQPWDQFTADDLHTTEGIAADAITFSGAVAVSGDLTIPQTKITVTMHNKLKDVMVRDTMLWTVPAGWSISPSGESLRIAGGGTIDFPVTVQCSESLYPLPTISLNLPFKAGRTMRVSKTLRVARQVNCQKVSGSVTIDGKLGEPCWHDPVTRLFKSDGSAVAIESTYFYFAYDAGDLYVAARCKESNLDSLRASITQRDGAIYSEDCIGLYLQPKVQLDTAYQIYFSALGTATDQKLSTGPEGYYDGDRKWNGTYAVKSTRLAGYWTVEARIPLGQFGIKAKTGLQLGLNFLRKQQRLHDFAQWQAPIDYNPDSYGQLIFK